MPFDLNWEIEYTKPNILKENHNNYKTPVKIVFKCIQRRNIYPKKYVLMLNNKQAIKKGE